MNDQDFRDEVLGSLARIDTKLTIVCGNDGNGGRLGELDDRLDDLEAEHDRTKGFLKALTIVGPLAVWLIEWLIHTKINSPH